jgi:CheY-like chemotaxis protein/anti-sigma regulatory factor (Ser/Thr protein kinase)
LEIIEKASFDGADTVRRVQEFSRKKDEDHNVNFVNVDLNEVINHTLEFTKVKWHDDAAAKDVKISIEKELSPLLPPVAGSASELREGFVNLINNAIDALPRGGEISLRTFTNNGHVVGVITDNGVGIPKDIQGKIFDPFFTTKGVQSTGLGMSASYGIIARHRGTITVESVEGKGTTFTIKLPQHEAAIKAIKEVEILPEQKRSATILVVEDEEDVRELLKDILTDGGHEVEFTPDGEKGIELFRQKRFDLVFTDLGMPGMSGWQVAENIKKICQETPVALITGWEVKQNDSELKASGVDLVVKKPFRVNEVLQLVQDWMKAIEEKEGVSLKACR